MKRKLSLLLAAILAISLLAACSPAANEPTGGSQPTDGGSTATTAPASESTAAPASTKDTITIIGSARAESLYPFGDSGRCGLTSMSLFSTLLTFDPQGNVIPLLAEGWEEDNETVTVFLRQDVTFHNGDHMTADDVVYSYDRLMESATLAPVMSQNMASYEKVDDYTVRFTKTAPYANMLIQIAMNSYVIPKGYHESVGNEGYETMPVGAGPYKFVSKDMADVVTLEAFDGFVGPQAGFKNCIIRPAQDPASAIIALEAGEVDFVTNVPAPQAALARNNSGLTVLETDGYSNTVLTLYGEPFISDFNLRKAIFHAISSENAIILGAEGAATKPNDLFAKKILGDAVGSIENYVGYDEALAKDYLAQSNYNGEELLISIFADPALAESVQADLKRVGINSAIEQLDLNSWITKLVGGELQLCLSTSGGLIYSLETTILTYSLAEDPMNTLFYAYDEELEELYALIKNAADPDERLVHVRAIQQMMYDKAMFVPIYDPLFYCAHSNEISYAYAISPGMNIYYPYQMKPA